MRKRINEYNSLEEFRNEYAIGKVFSWESDDGLTHYMGIEFSYKGVYYRMCREPEVVGDDDDWLPILPNGKRAHYDVMIYHNDKYGWPSCENVELIGWYEDIDDVLENCIIAGRKFKDVIMDPRTKIEAKD